MEVPENLVRVIQGEAERLVQYLPTLPPEAWGQPSACERWEVRDVIGHLTWMAEFYVEAVSRAVQGDVSPPEGFPAVGASPGASFDEFIAQRAIAWRESLGDQLLPTFSTRLAQLIHLLATRTPQDWEKPAYHFRMTVAEMSQVTGISAHGRDQQTPIASVAPAEPPQPALDQMAQRISQAIFQT